MSRNGSGTFTVVNTFNSGDTITASSHNANWSDLATEMTNSVAADGQTTMTGPLKAANGSVSSPAVTFASDTDTGMYRIGANNIGVGVNGAKVLDVSTTGLNVVGAVQQNGDTLMPTGSVLDYAGASAPTGWLLCYGQAISRSTYAALYAIIGTTYGTGDGSTTFNLPDCRGRAAAGRDDMGGSAASRITSAVSSIDGTALGAAGGAQKITLTRANLPNTSVSVAVTATDAGHTHVMSSVNHGNLTTASSGLDVMTTNTGLGVAVSSSTASGTASISASGSFNLNGNTTQTDTVVMQPTIIFNKIIKT